MIFGKNKNRKVRTSPGFAYKAGVKLKNLGKAWEDKKRKTILDRR